MSAIDFLQNSFQPIMTDSDFQQKILNSAIPAVVKFSASWCSDCKMMEPIDQQVARSFRPKFYGFSTQQTSPSGKVLLGRRNERMVPMNMGPGPVVKVPINFYTVDVDVLKNKAQQFSITNYPTYIFMKNGKEMFRVIEKPMSVEEFTQKVDWLLQ